jgi:3-methyladenine DNA glycosylase AlkC
MATPLKELYSEEFIAAFCSIADTVLEPFDPAAFTNFVFDDSWPQRELKDRMNHLAEVLIRFLPPDFSGLAPKVVDLIKALEAAGVKDKGLEYMFLPAIIEKQGLDQPDTAIWAMERITPYTSCEFAVRPFFLKYPEKFCEQALQWAHHSDFRVRRFASEGCRPRLPWAMAIPYLKTDPAPIIPVLETLKNDPEEWVRRSVANNLNDIAKDHPDLAYQLAASWKGISPETDWVVKHGCRTLLKKGIPKVLQLFGFADSVEIKVERFNLQESAIRIGEDLLFSFAVTNTSSHAVLLRLEYALHFLRANGSHSPKVFHLSEREINPHKTEVIEKKHPFRIITTRRYYPGVQHIAVLVNGVELARQTFELQDD